MAPPDESQPQATGRWPGRVGRAMMVAGLILVAAILIGVGYLFAISPGRPSSLRDAAGTVIPGSLSEG